MSWRLVFTREPDSDALFCVILHLCWRSHLLALRENTSYGRERKTPLLDALNIPTNPCFKLQKAASWLNHGCDIMPRFCVVNDVLSFRGVYLGKPVNEIIF